VPDEKGLTSLESSYGEEETSRRRDAALLRALSMPHKRQREMKVGKRKSRRDAPDEPEKSSS
jgi:hypothetical protein